MEPSIDADTNSTIESESLRSRRRKELIAEFLSIYQLESTIDLDWPEDRDGNTDIIKDIENFLEKSNKKGIEIEESIRIMKEYKERILKIFETIPSNHTQDIQINAILNEIHRLGLSERLVLTIEKEKQRINSEVKTAFQKSIFRPYSESEIEGRLSELTKICYDISSPETSEKIKNDFPSGNFLFHGTSVRGMIDVIYSGELSNFKKLHDAEAKRAEAEGRKPNDLSRNSGYEGISWSFNAVDALPGTRYHLAGFLTSPETVLNNDTQLVIPSRPAPYELLQVSKEIDSKRFYELKIQDEIYGSGGFSDRSVIENLICYEMSIGNDRSSVIKDFLSKESDLEKLTSIFRSKFTLREGKTVEFSSDLSQQNGEIIPSFLVWVQAIIDSGRISEIEGFENCQNVIEVIDKISTENYRVFFKEMRKDIKYIQNELKDSEEKISSLEVDVSQMYLVVPNEDLENYLRLFAATGKNPKGILVYDSKKISLENFASKSKGDHEEFTALLRHVVPQGDGAIDYEDEILGLKITSDIRVGHAGHVLKDSALTNRKIVVKGEDGNLIIK